MPINHNTTPAANSLRRVFFYTLGFLTQHRIRRILRLSGYNLGLGWPKSGDYVVAWGKSPYAWRSEMVARKSDARLIRVEDAWLRSVQPGRSGEPPLGLLVDHQGIHFDPNLPSDLETLLATHPLDDPDLLRRAETIRTRLSTHHLSKYNTFDPQSPPPDPGFVLVVDQTLNDASVIHGNADADTFRQMLQAARTEHPDKTILIKTHPETLVGHRQGYFGVEDQDSRTHLFADPISPHALLQRAAAVYVVSSQMGFEHILNGGTPTVFGQPFYAGWGLTTDRHPAPLPRRGRRLSTARLVAAAMILYPKWYDPYRDRLCEVETVLDTLEAMTRAWRDDHQGWDAYGMRLWKRRPLQQFFGREKPMRFAKDGAPAQRKPMVWATKSEAAPKGAIRIEDGFLRSKGLGADLIAPMSLVLDDLGIYFDPTSPSRLEKMIANRAILTPEDSARADTLRDRLIAHDLSKYNLGTPPPDLPKGHRILVPGQVEDDASILRGAGTEIRTNLDLLKITRRENPDAVILYKPHPDVEAGLRDGQVPPAESDALADLVLHDCNPASLLNAVDEVWTMTSLMGFEALIRGKSVTTTGVPFYAGWGLTRDLGTIPERRQTQVSLTGLIHAALIDYPRYFDPVSGLPCPVEIVLERLITDDIPHPGPANRALAKLQGAFASYAKLWR